MTNKEHSVLNHLVSTPDSAHTTCPLRVLQNIMLHTDGQVTAKGRLYKIVSKLLCPGVYSVSLEVLP